MTTRPFRETIFLIVGLLLPATIALGDGGMFFPWDPRGHAEVFQPTQKVYIQWNGTEEKLLIQTRYEGPAEEMVWIVPVPAEPTVTRGDAAIFEHLDSVTTAPDLSFTDFAGLQYHGAIGGAGGGSGGSSPAAWQRRVGDYDVVLLRPVEAESVLQWLDANNFSIPDEIAPVLEDYIANQWWMVASRIAPEALTHITRDKLADGTLHPLELVFASSACVYPMRLTSMAAGPVEELIYIKGPTHYEPVTFADEKWDIGLFSGPFQEVANGAYLSDAEYAIEVAAGRATRIPKPCITRLHRVFQPEEMMEDLVFGPLDYAKWLAGADPLRIAQAATQYGRQRDPNGIAPLLDTVSPALLDAMKPVQRECHRELPFSARILSREGLHRWSYSWFLDTYGGETEPRINMGCTHVRCCIWALGEIALVYGVDEAVEETLLYCAAHENQLIRMEAYLALIKLGSVRVGPILADRVTEILVDCPLSENPYSYGQEITSEMEIVTDWILRFGTTAERDVLVTALMRQIDGTVIAPRYLWNTSARQWPTPFNWTEWILWRTACTRDARLIAPLEALQARLIDEPYPNVTAIMAAEAACGSTAAAASMVQQIVDGEGNILAAAQTDEAGGIASLQRFFYSWGDLSLRVRIIDARWLRFEFYPMPPAAADAVLRAALADEGLSDWYALYLLARIEQPQSEDVERLLAIWNQDDEVTSLLAADVLFAWGDEPLLLDWYDRTDLAEVRAEIAWALAELETPQAAELIEEQARTSWNELWTIYESSFLLRPSSRSGYTAPEESLAIDAVRKAETLWHYFHPKPGVLDQERLACLQRLAADETIVPGMRIELLSSGYEGEAWAQPRLQAAATELLQADHTPETVRRLVSYASGELVVDIAGQAGSDEFRRSLLNSLLTGSLGRNLAVIEGLLWEVWPKRYAETDGAALLFQTPENPDFDGYCERDERLGARLADVLASLVQDGTLPAGYRAFLLIYWRGAAERIPADFVENLLQEDMPDFLHDALAQRLPEWP